MKQFDPFETDVDRSLFIEASAGTGKTFSIEQITYRLIAESGYKLDELALVTFTNKAAKELKDRIRGCLKEKSCHPRIAEALFGIDAAPIFTIHSFCLNWLRTLKEHPVDLKTAFLERNAIIEHLRGLSLESPVKPAEISRLLTRYPTLDRLVEALMRLSSGNWSDAYACFADQLKALERPLDSEKLLQDFCTLAADYKETTNRNGTLKKELLVRAEALSKAPFDPDCFLESGGVFIESLDPSKLKKRRQDSPLHYGSFFEEMQAIAPLWYEVSDPDAILLRLKYLLETLDDPDREALKSFDSLLVDLDHLLDDPGPLGEMSSVLKMVIIDEFQDTDCVQWSIFSKLMQAGVKVIVVGDPKQSIYGFRKADIYTYFSARHSFEHHYYLPTSYRSSYALTESLNSFFSKRKGDFLWLPRLHKTESFTPVLSADQNRKSIGPAITYLFAEVERPSLDAQGAYLIPFIIKELKGMNELDGVAILARDRAQIALCKAALEKAGIPVSADFDIDVKSSTAYPVLRAFVEALCGEVDALFRGPLFALTDKELQEKNLSIDFESLRSIATREGMPSALEALLQMEFKGAPIEKRSAGLDLVELRALIRLYESERLQDSFSWQAFEMEICSVKAGVGVTVTTIHKSKGLEYECVFAIGLIQRTVALERTVPTVEGLRPRKLTTEEELTSYGAELDAEKLRQLYVALTRAKSRLYIPIFLSEKKPSLRAASCMELYLGYCLSADLNVKAMYSSLEMLTCDDIEGLFGPLVKLESQASPIIAYENVEDKPLNYRPCHIQAASYSSLIQDRSMPTEIASPTEYEIPVGTETGLWVHEMMRRAFVTGAFHDFTLEAFERLGVQIGELSFFNRYKEGLFELIEPIFKMECRVGGSSFRLKDLSMDALMTEVPFLYQPEGRELWMKGFIDLMLFIDRKLVIIDWKTNWLKNYSKESVQAAIDHHQYDLQAGLYQEAALQMKLPWQFQEVHALYVFLRGPVTTKVEGRIINRQGLQQVLL